jgi:hypothetical protein
LAQTTWQPKIHAAYQQTRSKPEEPVEAPQLARLNRFEDVVSELTKRIEDLEWKRPKDQFRVAALLSHFGFEQRAAALAYRLFLEHRDMSQAWMTLTMIVLEGSRKPVEDAWSPTTVADHSAIVIGREGNEDQFLVIEPDASLRKLDEQSLEPDHPLVKSVIGLGVGDRFTGPDNREALIKSIRHKFVARAHYVMEHHEGRFPEIFGFKTIPIDLESPGGLDHIKDVLRQRHEWIEAERESYERQSIPFAVFAHRIGADPIDAAAAVATAGGKIKVARGWDTERESARREIAANGRKGCTIDLLTFWNAWRLGAAEAVMNVCGPMHLPRSVFDHLLSRRERMKGFLVDGHKQMFYREGQIAAQEIEPEVIATYVEDLEKALAWIESKATIVPLVAGRRVPEQFRDLIRSGKGDVLDGLFVAREAGMLYVSDDMPIREIAMSIFRKGGAWLHEIFQVAVSQQFCGLDDYARWTAHLIDAGQSYIGVSGATLHHSLRLDALTGGEAPGYFFKTIVQSSGGAEAEMVSHINACVQFIEHAWEDPALYHCRKLATGTMLEKMLRSRASDWPIVLDEIVRSAQVGSDFQDYIRSWQLGHFLLRP